jgi:hypothetical protein
VLGEQAARRRLLEEVYRPLEAAGGDLLGTAAAYLEGGGSVEGPPERCSCTPTPSVPPEKLTDVGRLRP